MFYDVKYLGDMHLLGLLLLQLRDAQHQNLPTLGRKEVIIPQVAAYVGHVLVHLTGKK